MKKGDCEKRLTRVEKPQGEEVFRHFSTEVGRTMKRSRFHIALENKKMDEPR